MATGFYEGSLTVEGIPDRHEPQAVTRRWSRRSRRLPHDGASDGATAPKRRVAKATPDSAEEGEATGVSEARSNASQHRGKKTPTPECSRHREVTTSSRGRTKARLCSRPIRRSGRGWREPPLPPAAPHGAADSVGSPRGESRDSGLGTREVRVHASRTSGRSRWNVSRVLSVGRSQGLVASQGASQKDARSTV